MTIIDQGKIRNAPFNWRGIDMANSDDWLITLNSDQIMELESVADRIESAGTPIEDLRREDVPLPTLAPQIKEWASELATGKGFILIRGLPTANYSESRSSIIYWIIGMHIGNPEPQNAAGDLLGHVRDTGRQLEDPSVRGYQTQRHLPFHTDACDVVGLLCFRPAKSGGRSRIVSSAAVYSEVSQRRPDLVPLMSEPFYYDWREEQGEGNLPYYTRPLVDTEHSVFNMQYVRHHIDSAQRFPELARLTDSQVALLDLIDEIANDQDLNLYMDFQMGDMQFLNNFTIMHSRTEFEDFEDVDRRRHLLRLWLNLHEGMQVPSKLKAGWNRVNS